MHHTPPPHLSRSLRCLLILAGLAGCLLTAGRLSANIVYFPFDATGDTMLGRRITAPGIASAPATLSNLTRNSINYNGDVAVTLTPARHISTGYSVDRTLESETYIAFSITVKEGHVLNLTGLEFQTTAGGEGTRAFYVFSDLTGFKPGKELLSDGRNGGLPIGPPLKQYSIPLDSLPPFQGLRGGQSVEFRIYIQTSGGSINFDDIRLLGTVVSG